MLWHNWRAIWSGKVSSSLYLFSLFLCPVSDFFAVTQCSLILYFGFLGYHLTAARLKSTLPFYFLFLPQLFYPQDTVKDILIRYLPDRLHTITETHRFRFLVLLDDVLMGRREGKARKQAKSIKNWMWIFISSVTVLFTKQSCWH